MSQDDGFVGWIGRVSGGDESAARDLIRRSGPRLGRVLDSMDNRDVCREDHVPIAAEAMADRVGTSEALRKKQARAVDRVAREIGLDGTEDD